jgi:flagellar basal body-associated protein FliL
VNFKNFFSKKTNAILSVILVLLSVLIAVQIVLSSSVFSAGEVVSENVQTANINPKYAGDSSSAKGIILGTEAAATTEPTEKATTAPETTENSTTAAATTAPVTTTAQPTSTIAQTAKLATAIPVDEPADYQTQWDAGYIIAIDNPDTSYSTYHIELSDEDRQLLENLCYGEFGSGGFVGAALIAQCVKDAMCFDGYTSVQDVITYCRYDGSTTSGTSLECQQAVTYIFDMDHDAVQHRLMYMYNPYLVASSFHESQNYILTYGDVRFFDRWGY